MCKKLFLLMSFLFVFSVLSGNVLAVDKTFVGTPASNNWNMAGNWNPAGVPIVGDRVFLLGDSAGAAGVVIDSNVDIGTAMNFAGNVVVVGNGDVGTALLTVNGGTITTGPVYVGYLSPGIAYYNGGIWNTAATNRSWNIGAVPDITGVLNMSSGTIYTGELILKGTGSQLSMTGGNIYANNDIEVHTGARLDLKAGTIEQVTAFGYAPSAAEFLIEYGAVIDIEQGRLILNGDASAAVDGYVNIMGVITGYSDAKKVYWDYNVTTPGKTTVWAQTTARQEINNDVVLLYSDFGAAGASAADFSSWDVVDASGNTVYIGSSTDLPPGTTGWAFQADNSHKEEPLETLNPCNTIGATAVIVDFWFKDHGLVSNGTLPDKNSIKLKFFNTAKNWVYTVNTNFYVTKDQWTHYTYILTDPQFMRADLKIRININYMGTGDTFGLDEFRLIARKPALAKPTVAAIPDPASGNPYLKTSKQLSWQAGYLSVSHDVYFGTDSTAITNATKTSALCVSKNQTGITYSPTLANNKTYYWRIDENYTGATDPAFPASGTLKGNVWNFKTLTKTSDDPSNDPNLIAYWKMNDPTGIWDASGNELIGKLVGHAAIVLDPNDGYSLSLDGTDDAVGITNYKGIIGGHSRTITAWIKTPKTNNQAIISWGDHETNLGRWEFMLNASGFARLDVDTGNATGTTKINDNQWQFVAVALDNDGTPITNECKLYINGEPETATSNNKAINTLSRVDVCIGRLQTADFFRGKIKDVRLYNRALSATEIGNMITHDQAWGPYPVNKTAALGQRNPILTWKTGINAVSHDVYFGTDQTIITDANTIANQGTYKGRKTVLQYALTDVLTFGKTYYWRVDEVDASSNILKGNVWWFTIANYYEFDNFESYNDVTKPIGGLDGWGDNATNPDSGGHVSIGIAPDPVRNIQSMKFAYDNFDWAHWTYYCSEVVKVLPQSENWSRISSGLALLSLEIYGTATNGAEKLYIALEDQSGHSFTIYNSDPNVLINAAWQTWEIPLSSFTGVNLTQIKKIVLGAGTRKETSPPPVWMAGTVFFDNVRVYPPTCKADKAKPLGDLSNNCKVDLADIRIIANNWLTHDVTITPTPVSADGLKVQWTFESGTATDSSGNENTGTITPTGVTAVDDPSPARGKVMNFDGTAGYISMPAAAFASISNEITISLWQNGGTAQPINCSIFNGDAGSSNRILNSHLPWSSGTIIWDAGLAGTAYDRISKAATATQYKGQWNHWAFTKNATTGEMNIYLNGQLWTSGTGMTKSMSGITRFNVGSGFSATTPFSPSNFYNGMVDDFRIYSRVLSGGEIATLAGITQPVVIPVDAAANLKVKGVSGQETIDYRDFSVIADNWFKEVLWP